MKVVLIIFPLYNQDDLKEKKLSFLKNIIVLKPGEGKKVFTFFLFNFFTVAMSITAKTARDAYFLTSYDRSILPLMFMVVALGVAAALFIYTHLAKKISNRQLFIYTCSLFMVTLIASQFFIIGWFIPVIYVWVDVVIVIMLIQFWEFTSESFESRQAKRLFGLIGGGGSFAALLIGLGLKPFVMLVGTDWLLILAAGFILISMILGLAVLKDQNSVEKSRRKKHREKNKKQKLDPFLFRIAVVISLSAVVSTIVDYQFKIIASDTFPDIGDLVGFFGNFYALTGFASLIMQFFISGPVLSRYGILAGLLMLPIMLTAGASSLLITPILFSATFAKFSDQTFKFTINNSSMELLWLPIPVAKRKTAKPLISGTVKSFAEGLAGLATFFIVKVIALPYLSIFALSAIAIWLVTAIRLKGGYVKALMSAIEKRQLDFEELTLDVQDAAMVSTIEKTLGSDDEIKQLFALDLIDGLPLNAWAKTLRRLFSEGSMDVRKRILTLAWDETDILSDETIIATMQEENGIANDATMVAGKRKIKSVLPTLFTLLTDENVETRASAASAILQIGSEFDNTARDILTVMLDTPEEKTQVIALKKLVDNQGVLPLEKLITFLKNESPAISNTALAIARNRKDDTCIPAIVTNLDIPQTALQARQVLKVFPEEKVLVYITDSLHNPDLSRKRRIGLIRTLKEYPGNSTVNLLMEQLDREDFLAFSEAVESLLIVARSEPLPDEILNSIKSETWELARQMYSLNETIHLLPEDRHDILLKDYLETEIKKRIPTLMKLGVLDVPDTPVETYIHTVVSGDISRLSFVLEFFENIFSKEERTIINPILEPITVLDRSQIGMENFQSLPKNLSDELTKAAYSPNKWQSVIALDYLFNTNKLKITKQLNWNKVPNSNANRELIARQLSKNETDLAYIPTDRFKFETDSLSMYSTLEKTIILKTVSLFGTIPAENLSRIAQITEEVQYSANAPIFREGDYGDSLFIVVEGSVQIRKGNKDLATLGKGSFLGEMALLDQEPRSADAIVTEDTTLFKIAQEEFYEVMGSNSEIMQGIIKLLTGRLREANEKLMVK